MESWVDSLLVACAILLGVPVAIFVIECAAAYLPARSIPVPRTKRPRLAVLVPAHDEQSTLFATLAAVRLQLSPGDRLLVVADNCTDHTAEIARRAGAEVAERVDSERRGKGFALDHGVRLLAQDPPEVLVMLDADTRVHPGALDALAHAVAASGRPVQAAYVLARDRDAGAGSARDAVSILAFTVKNVARPTGLSRLGLPCLLTGTGMAFPWNVIRAAPLASANLVEDMQLGLDLALAGSSAHFCESARVSGVLPAGERAAFGQRTRWEHGHLRTALAVAPNLALRALRSGRVGAFVLALDVLVPPLALLFLAIGAGLTLALAFAALRTGSAPLAVQLFALELALASAAVIAAWWRFARRDVELRELVSVPGYVLWKIPLYARFLLAPQRAWVRTERVAPSRTSTKEL